jgi:hypothetical protein
MKNKVTVADLIMGLAGLLTFIFSFLAFFKFGDTSINAWDDEGFAFASTLPAILGLAMAVWIALELAGVKLPDQVLTYTPTQLKGTWAIAAAGIMLSWLSTDGDKGAGFYLMLLGSLVMAAGAVMALLGKGTETVNIGGTRTSHPASTAPPPPPPV